MADATRLTATGLIDGERVTLDWREGIGLKAKWHRGKSPMLDGDLVASALRAHIGLIEVDGSMTMANAYQPERNSALWAYIIMEKIFDQPVEIKMNGDRPTIPWEPGVIY